jgi:nucleotide-binding universal stress UspA family protein
VKNSVQNPYKNILAPTDFERQSKQSVIFAKNIFPTSKIKIVHVYETFHESGPYAVENISLMKYNQTVKAYAENNLKFFLKNVDIKDADAIDGKENSIDALAEYIEDGKYDLVVVGSRGISGFGALLGSVASFIAREVENDVLVYVPID